MSGLSWRDMNLILQEALTTSESDSVQGKALAYANEIHMQNNQPPGVEAIPPSHPSWGYDLKGGRWAREHMLLCLLQGMKASQRKPVHCHRLAAIDYGSQENPSFFIES